MHPQVFWLDHIDQGLIGIMPRPRGGDWLTLELQALVKAGVAVLVSLITADEIAELDLHDELRLCKECGIRFVSFPIPDRGVPASLADTTRVIDLLLGELRTGKTVVIHCRMGIGRSAMIAACLLKSQGIGADEAFAQISHVRGFAVPDTEEQREWVMTYDVHNG